MPTWRTRTLSPCKRIDHRHIQFATPWFMSYDCGQRGGELCKDFEPKECWYWLYNHWKPEFLEEPWGTALTGLVLDKDTKLRFYVKTIDFFNNTFLNKDGSLKWVKKTYYKQSRNSPTGYVLIREFPDGTKQEYD